METLVGGRGCRILRVVAFWQCRFLARRNNRACGWTDLRRCLVRLCRLEPHVVYGERVALELRTCRTGASLLLSFCVQPLVERLQIGSVQLQLDLSE